MAMYDATICLCHLLMIPYVATLCMWHFCSLQMALHHVSIICMMACLMLNYVFSSPQQPRIMLHYDNISSLISSHNPHQVCINILTPHVILHYIRLILLMIMYVATLCLFHLLDSKPCPCHLLINSVWHYDMSMSSPWWPHLTLNYTPFPSWPHMTPLMSTSSPWWPHMTLICRPLCMHIMIHYNCVIALTACISDTISKSSLSLTCMMLYICLFP